MALALPLAAMAVAILVWARFRWFAQGAPDWPLPAPYPDKYLLQLHDFFDAAFSSPAGVVKIDGEFHSVLFTLNLSIWAAISILSLLSGILFAKSRTATGGITNR